MKTDKDHSELPQWARGSTLTDLARIIRPGEACRLLGRSRSSLWRDVRDGRLPAPIKIGPRARGWVMAILLEARERLNATADR